MSDFSLADGFGNLTDGTHTAGATREILGNQWGSFAADFSLVDRGDGRKWMSGAGSHIDLKTAGLGLGAEFKFHIRIYRGTTTAVNFGTVVNSSGVRITGLGINSSGNLVLGTDNVYPGSLNGIAHPSTGTIPLLTETVVEYHVKLGNGTDGFVKYYINGVFDSEHLSVDTAQGTFTCDLNVLRVCYDSRGSTTYDLPASWKISDLIIHTGTAPLGDVGVFYIESDAAGVDNDFTPSAGSNHQNVDEIGPDEDTTYNESDGTSGHRDSFQGGSISDLDVLSVCALVRARKVGAGGASLLVGAVHGGSEDQSSAKGLSEDYLTLAHFVDDNPSTSLPWTPAEVGAGEASYEVV